MKSEENVLRFFLGANTPQGFVSKFDHLTGNNDGWRTEIIKGGPGVGKSTMLKEFASVFADKKLELIHCSSDVDSLDAVICPEKRFAAADGTSPHADAYKIIRPHIPAAYGRWYRQTLKFAAGAARRVRSAGFSLNWN